MLSPFRIAANSLWRSNRRVSFCLMLAALFVVVGMAGENHSYAIQTIPDRPNIILINLDDADIDLFTDELLDEYLPNIKRLASGLRLTNFHVTTPLCGPSRTCLLRGQYAHRTGIKTNLASGLMNNGFSGGYSLFKQLGYDQENLGVWMHRAGYRTMMIGKYHHGRMNPDGLPGWDDLHVCLGGKYYGTARFSTRLPVGQRRQPIAPTAFRTTVEADEAVWMIEQQAIRNAERNPQTPAQPFFLYLAPLAPHKPSAGNVMLEKKYRNLGREIELPETPDLNEEDVSDKPPQLQITQLSDEVMDAMNEEFRKRLVSIKSVDDMVGRMLAALEETGVSDNTYLFFTSDHGYQLGHNRMIAKKVPFHRNTVVPMFVIGPGVTPGVANHLLAHIDLVPTFLELAGGKATVELDGKSLVPILKHSDAVSPDDFRSSLIIENWEAKGQSGTLIPATYSSLRTNQTIYTEWSNGQREFYDLAADPYQIQNCITSLSDEQRAEFSKQLHRLKQGPVTPIATIASPELICKNTVIRGFAEDDESVTGVEVVVHDPHQARYWNGSDWQAEKTGIDASLANAGGLITDWEVSLDLSQVENNGRLDVAVRARDNQNNLSKRALFSFRVDSISPETLLKLPADGSTVESPVIIAGTGSDNEKLRGIELELQNLDDQLFWDGQHWTQNRSTFFKRVGQLRWHVELELKPGRYRVSASANDVAGNHDETPATSRFTVK